MAQESPYMLIGIRHICRVYKVSGRTVRKWIDDGAPIAWLGEKTGYRALLPDLQAWLIERARQKHRAMCDQAMRELRKNTC